MNSLDFQNIRKQCKELELRFERHGGEGGFRNFLNTMRAHGNSSIISLSRIFPKLSEQQLVEEKKFPAPSSNHSSDLFDNPDRVERPKTSHRPLGYREIEKLLIDENCIAKIPKSDRPERNKEHVILLERVTRSLDYFKFVDFINSLSLKPEFLLVRFCIVKNRYSLILQFMREDQASKFFASCERKIPNFVSVFGEKFEVFWIKNTRQSDSVDTPPSSKNQFIRSILDITAPKIHKNHIHLYSPGFIGVVLRSIPENYECMDIIEYLQKIKIIAELQQLIEIRGEIFGLLRLNSIEDAENTCMFLNERILGQKALKAHIHAKSNYTRHLGEQRTFKQYFESDAVRPAKYLEVLNNLREVVRSNRREEPHEAKSEALSRHSSSDERNKSKLIRQEEAA
jgi:hypothetical protein